MSAFRGVLLGRFAITTARGRTCDHSPKFKKADFAGQSRVLTLRMVEPAAGGKAGPGREDRWYQSQLREAVTSAERNENRARHEKPIDVE